MKIPFGEKTRNGQTTWPQSLKKFCRRLSFALALAGLFFLLADVLVGMIFLIPAGLLFFLSSAGKTREDTAADLPSPSFRTEEFFVTGVSYCQDSICKLAVRNPDWKKQTKTLLSAGMAGKPVFRCNFINKPVKLIPEPTNEHDKNAVMIQIAGEKAGYIQAQDALHVKDILENHQVKYISAFLFGGQYKIPREDGELIKGEDPIRVKIKIGYR